MNLTAHKTARGTLVCATFSGLSPLVDGCRFPDAEEKLTSAIGAHGIPTYSEGSGAFGRGGKVFAFALLPDGAHVDAAPAEPNHYDLVVAELLSRGTSPSAVDVWTMIEDTSPHDHRPRSRSYYLPQEYPPSWYESHKQGLLAQWGSFTGRHVRQADPSIIFAVARH